MNQYDFNEIMIKTAESLFDMLKEAEERIATLEKRANETLQFKNNQLGINQCTIDVLRTISKRL